MVRQDISAGGVTVKNVTNITELLERVEDAAKDKKQISVETVHTLVGSRSFGPWMLLSGLILVAPLVGDIPGVPTSVGLLVLLVAGQLVIGRERFWLPAWLLKRTVASAKLRKAIGWLKRPARWVDSLVKPRLVRFAQGPATRVIALLCVVIGLGLPVMEVVPFSANFGGIALIAFGLSLIAHDGLLAIGALAFTALTAGVVVWGLL